MTTAPDTHAWLAEAARGGLSPQELFPKLASTVTTYLTLLEAPQGPSDLPRPALLAGSAHGQVAALYTDREAARVSLGEKAERLQEHPALTTLALVFRAGLKGIVINPGTAELLIAEQALRLLFREYALAELTRAGGAWVPTKDASLMVLQAMPHIYTIPVYLRQVDCEAYVAKTGGHAEFHSWTAIRQRSLEAGTDGVYLQCSNPEQMGLPRPLVTQLAGIPEPDPLDAVEAAIGEAHGELSAQALWPILSRLDRIWILGDKRGTPVDTGKVFDCFTALPLADRFRMQNDVKGTPHFVKASAFFQHAAAKGLQVGINRGLAHSWTGVLQAIS